MRTLISLIALLLAGAVYAPEMPVTVSHVVTGAPSHVRLTNTSPQAVTAWSLATTAVSGDRTHREVYTADGYLSEVTHGLAGASAKLERLLAGAAAGIVFNEYTDEDGASRRRRMPSAQARPSLSRPPQRLDRFAVRVRARREGSFPP